VNESCCGSRTRVKCCVHKRQQFKSARTCSQSCRRFPRGPSPPVRAIHVYFTECPIQTRSSIPETAVSPHRNATVRLPIRQFLPAMRDDRAARHLSRLIQQTLPGNSFFFFFFSAPAASIPLKAHTAPAASAVGQRHSSAIFIAFVRQISDPPLPRQSQLFRDRVAEFLVQRPINGRK